jgi:ABC-2 type transport system permease protein
MNLWTHEMRLLWRDTGNRLSLALWVLALLYALFTGWTVQRTAQRQQQTHLAQAAQRLADQRQGAEQAAAGLKGEDPYISFPSRLRAPAVLPVAPLAFLSVGELDLRPNTATVALFTREGQFSKNNALQSPNTLMMGRFDLAFAVTVLLPLVLIALGYTQLAEERESQRLGLLAAQGSVAALLWRRMLLRAGWVALPLTLLTLLAAMAMGGSLLGWLNWLDWWLASMAWLLLWTALCAAVGWRAGHAGQAVAVLVAIWLVLVLLLPATLQAVQQAVLPSPSPLKAVVAARQAEVEADRSREQVLGRYVSDHPELEAGKPEDDLAWVRDYYAQGQFIEKRIAPILAASAAAQAQQEALHARLRWLSPVTVLEHALTEAAGTSALRYQAFEAQLRTFKKAWDAPLLVPAFKGENLKASAFDALPRFVFQEAPQPRRWLPAGYLLGLALLVLLALWGVGFLNMAVFTHSQKHRSTV